MVSPLLISPIFVRPPDFLASVGGDGDSIVIERIIDEFAISEDGAAVDHIAARNALGGGAGQGIIAPFQCAALLEIQREKCVWIGRHDIHRIADNQRRCFLASVQTC